MAQMLAVTNNEGLKDGVSLIAENHNLRCELEDLKRMLTAFQEVWVMEGRAEEMKRAEAEAQRQRETDEAIERIEKLMHRDYSKGYLPKLYGREKPRLGQRRIWQYD